VGEMRTGGETLEKGGTCRVGMTWCIDGGLMRTPGRYGVGCFVLCLEVLVFGWPFFKSECVMYREDEGKHGIRRWRGAYS